MNHCLKRHVMLGIYVLYKVLVLYCHTCEYQRGNKIQMNRNMFKVSRICHLTSALCLYLHWYILGFKPTIHLCLWQMKCKLICTPQEAEIDRVRQRHAKKLAQHTSVQPLQLKKSAKSMEELAAKWVIFIAKNRNLLIPIFRNFRMHYTHDHMSSYDTYLVFLRQSGF